MDTSRFVITDHQWERMEAHCLGRKTDPGRNGSDPRQFLEAVFWIARTGAPWRDLPSGFGNWNTVYRRFRDWAGAGVFERIFNAVSDDPDMEMAMVDATIVKVHRSAQGAKGGSEPGYRQVERRLDNEDIGPHRLSWKSGAVRAFAR